MSAADLQQNVQALARVGFVVIPDAIAPGPLAPILKRYDELMSDYLGELRKAGPVPGHVDLVRIIERDPIFEPLMDWPSVFPLARAQIGKDITLSTGGEGDYRPPNAPAYISWHND